MASLPISQTLEKLERIVHRGDNNSVKRLEFSDDESRLKYLLHKYAYEDETKEDDDQTNDRALRRPGLKRPKNKFAFPFRKSEKKSGEIPYDKNRKLRLQLLREEQSAEQPRPETEKRRVRQRLINSASQEHSAVNGSNNFSRLAHSIESRPVKSSKLHDEVSKHTSDSRNHIFDHRETVLSRKQLFQLLDGTSFLQARPGFKLPPIKDLRPQSKVMPYLVN